jgi:hypothetical protein
LDYRVVRYTGANIGKAELGSGSLSVELPENENGLVGNL